MKTLFCISKNGTVLRINQEENDFWLFIQDDRDNVSGIDLDLRDLIFLRSELNAIISEINHDEED